ncbi:MAG: phage tail sheath family protein [Nitrosomonas sp.]|uniref:phage tail sheath family protein n=1 Tax=Nitrosomonas sp. TaxID=42353 RepID=UPI0032F09538
MPNYLTPGIYVEEISTGPRPIGMVGTSTAAFLGVAPDKNKNINQAIACNNWGEFCKFFIGDDSKSTDLSNAVFSFFNQGGSRCYIVNVGENGSIAGDVRNRSGIYALDPIDEIAIVAAPGFSDPISYEALLAHCEKLRDRFCILDAPAIVNNIDSLKELNVIASKDPESTKEENPKKGAGNASKGLRPRNSDGGFGAFYFPWYRGKDPLEPNTLVNMPPSGAIAGIYARTDATRGVHKAPANEIVRGALGLTYDVTQAEQGELNRLGVNVIRHIGQAIRVWGARTLVDEASEWRYVPVRRTLLMTEESIEKGLLWSVFEPNDLTTWKSIERDVRLFLMRLWRNGALQGTTPEQAFFVKCDAETNSPEIIDAGQLIVEIGVAPVKPAEFIIIRIGLGASETESTTTVGA